MTLPVVVLINICNNLCADDQAMVLGPKMSTKNRPKCMGKQKCKQLNVPIKKSEHVIIVSTPTGNIIHTLSNKYTYY